ncbi:MAG: hypothetical protein CVU39_07250 [Chloroflexi bacterium HGW-Chloroflexi-10]|nr:MAG: hypothetical protein CVU39_07250 [Chloroflexi bacterium HGW-Chloroflexi-10]
MAIGNMTWNRGDITNDIYYDLIRKEGKPDLPVVRLILMINGLGEVKPVYGLRIVAYGALAELAYGHLQKSSRIGIEGHIQIRDREEAGSFAFEVVANHIEFIRNINYERGNQVVASLRNRNMVQPAPGKEWVSISQITSASMLGARKPIVVE